jgi:signal transduction histidine kinase
MRTLTCRDQIRNEQLIHDIRSPLSAIRGYAQLLHRRLASDGAQAADVEDGLRHITEAATRLGQLLDQLAESATPDTTGAFHRQPTDLVQLACRVATESEAAASGNSPVVVLPAVAELVGRWDGVCLERVLANPLRLIARRVADNRLVAGSD